MIGLWEDEIKFVSASLLSEAFGEGLLFFAEFFGESGADFVEEGFLVLEVARPVGGMDFEDRLDLLGREVQARKIQGVRRRGWAHRSFRGLRFSLDPFQGPEDRTQVFAEARPKELARRLVAAEPVHMENLRGFFAELFAHVDP